ncbi:uncharacterized protein VTP21DRAFT_2279 [Calcarisporiella thermophila]|uniref:uncharacterized protein n=1 Tax=Calcarisporiella thermophila TaxID=911321 RepID=UPI0037433381
MAENTSQTHLRRAGLDPTPRVYTVTFLGALWGLSTGGYVGGRQSALQFLAENAHRLPRTIDGWYLYHKRKNYKVLWGGLKMGLRHAKRNAILCAGFEVAEAALDRWRDEADALNSIVAGAGTGFAFSLINKFSKQGSKHAVVLGAILGLLTGGLNDFTHWNENITYRRWLRKCLPGEKFGEQS